MRMSSNYVIKMLPQLQSLDGCTTCNSLLVYLMLNGSWSQLENRLSFPPRKAYDRTTCPAIVKAGRKTFSRVIWCTEVYKLSQMLESAWHSGLAWRVVIFLSEYSKITRVQGLKKFHMQISQIISWLALYLYICDHLHQDTYIFLEFK